MGGTHGQGEAIKGKLKKKKLRGGGRGKQGMKGQCLQ